MLQEFQLLIQFTKIDWNVHISKVVDSSFKPINLLQLYKFNLFTTSRKNIWYILCNIILQSLWCQGLCIFTICVQTYTYIPLTWVYVFELLPCEQREKRKTGEKVFVRCWQGTRGALVLYHRTITCGGIDLLQNLLSSKLWLVQIGILQSSYSLVPIKHSVQ